MDLEFAASARPLAAVTGGSSGIGREIARELATRGYDLLIGAEDDEIDHAASALRSLGVEVTTVRADLRRAEAVDRFYNAVWRNDHHLAVLALNAGIGRGGAFLETDIDDEIAVIDLTIVSMLRLAKLVLPRMVEQGSGRVLVTSPVASVPGSFRAVHDASRSFLQSWTEALQDELRDTPVALTSLIPPTEAALRDRAGVQGTRLGRSDQDDLATLARRGVDALLAGKPRVTGAGLVTRLQDAAGKLTPDHVKAAMRRTVPRRGASD